MNGSACWTMTPSQGCLQQSLTKRSTPGATSLSPAGSSTKYQRTEQWKSWSISRFSAEALRGCQTPAPQAPAPCCTLPWVSVQRCASPRTRGQKRRCSSGLSSATWPKAPAWQISTALNRKKAGSGTMVPTACSSGRRRTERRSIMHHRRSGNSMPMEHIVHGMPFVPQEWSIIDNSSDTTAKLQHISKSLTSLLCVPFGDAACADEDRHRHVVIAVMACQRLIVMVMARPLSIITNVAVSVLTGRPCLCNSGSTSQRQTHHGS